jgi:hypothetical protein
MTARSVCFALLLVLAAARTFAAEGFDIVLRGQGYSH